MCFFKKKKKASEESDATIVGRLLGNVLYNHRRTEKRTVRVGVFNPKNAPCAFLEKTDLGPALRGDLGEEGAVLLYYVESEGELVLRLTFSYGEGSEEMKLLEECLDSIYIEEDEELILPGDVTRIHTEYMVDENDEVVDATDVNFIAEGVEKKDVARAAESLVGYVFDWLDTVYEAFEEEFGEGDFDEDEE